MEITKEILLARKEALQSDAANLANLLQVLHGAIQDVDHWVSVVEKEEPKVEEHGDH